MSVDSRFAAPALASLKDCALDDPRLPTPLFVIDSQKLEKNLRRAQDRAAKLGVAFRPHLKTHKSIGIALRQMTTPQGPATVSTLAEARYFGARGVTDLIYAVGIAPQKLAEVSRLPPAIGHGVPPSSSKMSTGAKVQPFVTSVSRCRDAAARGPP